jgi:hypothetical protein
LKKFVKKSNYGLTYYYLGHKKWKWDCSTGEKDILAVLNKKDYVDTRVVDKTFYSAVMDKDIGEAIALPTGYYSFNRGQYPMPDEYLAEKAIRVDDDYLEVPELKVLKNDLELFMGSESIYEELGTPYRRGYLMYGAPGNGKTALIRSLVQADLFKDMHIIWANTIPSEKMVAAFNEIKTKKLIIFEEIINQNWQIDFDMTSFLNFMDGENMMKNTIVIATTNYPEKLTENLADRPSRFDVTLRFDNPSREMIKKTFNEYLKDDSDIDYIADLKFSFAHIKEVILLHKMHKISVVDACKRIIAQREQFKSGFQEKKSFGLMGI